MEHACSERVPLSPLANLEVTFPLGLQHPQPTSALLSVRKTQLLTCHPDPETRRQWDHPEYAQRNLLVYTSEYLPTLVHWFTFTIKVFFIYYT